MPSPIRTIETDVCVVGAGLTGLAHAHEARRRGLNVVVLERNPRAAGASVRHSGHLFFSALPSAVLDVAPLARERWLELARRAGTAADEGGTLMVARHRDELAVMEAIAADPRRQARMRSAKKLAKLAPIPIDGVLGALHAKQDLRIAPRSAPAALARLLANDPDAHIEWGAQVHEVEPGLVHAGALRVRAGAIVLCPGAARRLLPLELQAHAAGMTVQRAQMLRLAAPTGRRYRQTLNTGLSLLAHPGLCELEGIEALRRRLELEAPELIEHRVDPVVTQLAEGELIVGSTTTYRDSPTPYSRDRLDDLLLSQVQALLGRALTVRQRWSSMQPAVPGSPDDFLTTRPMPGVRIVHAVRPTSAALCHTHARTVLEHLLAEPGGPAEYIRVHDLRKGRSRPAGIHDHASAFGANRDQPG